MDLVEITPPHLNGLAGSRTINGMGIIAVAYAAPGASPPGIYCSRPT